MARRGSDVAPTCWEDWFDALAVCVIAECDCLAVVFQDPKDPELLVSVPHEHHTHEVSQGVLHNFPAPS